MKNKTNKFTQKQLKQICICCGTVAYRIGRGGPIATPLTDSNNLYIHYKQIYIHTYIKIYLENKHQVGLNL